MKITFDECKRCRHDKVLVDGLCEDCHSEAERAGKALPPPTPDAALLTACKEMFLAAEEGAGAWGDYGKLHPDLQAGWNAIHAIEPNCTKIIAAPSSLRPRPRGVGVVMAERLFVKLRQWRPLALIFHTAFTRHCNELHNADYAVCRDGQCRHAWFFERWLWYGNYKSL